MSQDEIFSRVQRVIVDTLDLGPVNVQRDTRIKEDLAADSMQVITIIIALDQEFDCEFNTDEIPKGTVTVGWIAEFVARTIARNR
jgi:acyl carrier protein